MQLKIKRNMHLLHSCRNFMDVRSGFMVYNAHIQSHVIYCLSIWGNMINNEQKSCINCLMQKCTTIIDKTGRTKNTVFNLSKLVLLENYKFGFRIVNDLLPTKVLECAKMDQKGTKLTKNHRYGTRLKSVPNLPKSSTSQYSKSIFCSGLRNYTKLPSNVCLSSSYHSFISDCKKLLIEGID